MKTRTIDLPNLPQLDRSRFPSLEPSIVLGIYLTQTTTPLSRKTLSKRLARLMPSEAIDRAARALATNGHAVTTDEALALVNTGHRYFKKALGSDASSDWNAIQAQRLVVLALGEDPDNKSVRHRLAKIDAVRARSISIGYDLALPPEAPLSTVRSALTWKLLKLRLGDIIGQGPLPNPGKSDVYERVLLLQFARLSQGKIGDATATLAARCVGLQTADAEQLRMALIQQALKPAIPNSPRPKPSNRGAFAHNVLDVAVRLSTPPFNGQVAIAQIYDEYGRHHADAGSLAEFKRRLIEAARAQELHLQRLDMPETMGRDLRERSQTSWGSHIVHFVLTTKP